MWFFLLLNPLNSSQPILKPVLQISNQIGCYFRNTSAVKYSRIAALYTAAVAPTRPLLVVLCFKCLCIRPTGNYVTWHIDKHGRLKRGRYSKLLLYHLLRNLKFPDLTWRPALCERETAFAFVLASFPAFPPGCVNKNKQSD